MRIARAMLPRRSAAVIDSRPRYYLSQVEHRFNPEPRNTPLERSGEASEIGPLRLAHTAGACRGEPDWSTLLRK
jgi:hypothetical protein